MSKIIFHQTLIFTREKINFLRKFTKKSFKLRKFIKKKLIIKRFIKIKLTSNKTNNLKLSIMRKIIWRDKSPIKLKTLV